MAIQMELKFKVHNFQFDLSDFNYDTIYQYFIIDSPVNEERRYRKKVLIDGTIRYSYITKNNGDLERDILPEIPITEEIYTERLTQKTGTIIKKRRYTLYFDGDEITSEYNPHFTEVKLDVYCDRLNGLVTVEVPVTDIEDAKSVYLPISLGVLENVTNNPLYKNSELSLTSKINQVLFKKQYEVNFNNLIAGIINTDANAGITHRQDLKFLEEIGELAETILKDLQWVTESKIKGTIAEELFDVVYYLLTKLIENNIEFDMSLLSESTNDYLSLESFRQLDDYIASLNRKYDDKNQYQKRLLNYFLMRCGDIAAKDLEEKIKTETEKNDYRSIINELIIIVFEIARVNNVNMEKAAIVKELKNSIKYNRQSHFLVSQKNTERKSININSDNLAQQGHSSPPSKKALTRGMRN